MLRLEGGAVYPGKAFEMGGVSKTVKEFDGKLQKHVTNSAVL